MGASSGSPARCLTPDRPRTTVWAFAVMRQHTERLELLETALSRSGGMELLAAKDASSLLWALATLAWPPRDSLLQTWASFGARVRTARPFELAAMAWSLSVFCALSGGGTGGGGGGTTSSRGQSVSCLRCKGFRPS